MKSSRHENAYVRVAALVAAIMRLIRHEDMEESKIRSVLVGARKKVWKAFPMFWDDQGEVRRNGIGDTL